MASPAPATRSAIPRSIRMKAWWEGYRAEDLFARTAVKPAPALPEVLLPPAEIQVALRPGAWPAAYIDAAQRIWGTGFAEPLPAWLMAAARMQADARSNVMIANAGLGGLQDTVQREAGIAADGYDVRDALVLAAADLHARTARNNAPPLLLLDLTLNKPFLRRYDLALLDGLVSSTRDLGTLVGALAGTMTAGGRILVQDWFCTGDMPLAEIRRVIAQTGNPDFAGLWTVDALIAVFAARGLGVVRRDNVTADAVGQIADSWRALHDVMVGAVANPPPPGLLAALHREIEKWQCRTTLARDSVMAVHGLEFQAI